MSTEAGFTWGLGTWLPLFLYLCHFSVRPILTIPRKSSISILHWCLQMPSSLFCFFLHLSFSRYYTSIYYVYYMFSFSIRSMLQEVGSFVLLKRIFLTDVVSFFLFFFVCLYIIYFLFSFEWYIFNAQSGAWHIASTPNNFWVNVWDWSLSRNAEREHLNLSFLLQRAWS